MSNTDQILANLRTRLPNSGSGGHFKSLSSQMENVSLLSYLEPHDGKAIASFRVASTNPTFESISSGIKKLFNNEMEVVPGSLKIKENTQFFTSVSAHIKRAHVTKAIGKEGKIPTNFVSLSKNIFMEERDSTTWKLVEAGDGKKILVRDASVETDADMEQLLSSLSSVGHEFSPASKQLCSQANDLIEKIEPGALLIYADDDGTSLAFAVESMGYDGKFSAVLCKGRRGVINDLHASSVVEVIDSTHFINEIEIPATDSVSLSSGGRADVNVLVEYYRKLFGNNQEYFNQISERIRNSGLAIG